MENISFLLISEIKFDHALKKSNFLFLFKYVSKRQYLHVDLQNYRKQTLFLIGMYPDMDKILGAN